MPARQRVGVSLLHERACGSPAIGEWVAEQARACLLAGEWAFHSCTSGRVTRRRVGEWGGREGRGVLLGASRTDRVDFVFSDGELGRRRNGRGHELASRQSLLMKAFFGSQL